MDISDLRREYESQGLQADQLDPNPLVQFKHWFGEARAAGIEDVNAMSLATANGEGVPGIRTVLLKYFDAQGFVFFTNYESHKAQDIASNPHAALLFPWLLLNRQVIVQGQVERVGKGESLRYFMSRPRDSQLGAWVSAQSRAISSRGLLEQKFAEIKRKFNNGQVPLPDFWGGYRVKPWRIEFWQGRPNRLHDRFEYLQQGDQWLLQRLQP